MNREQRERHEHRETDNKIFRGENYNGHSVLESWTANDANKEKQTVQTFRGFRAFRG